MIVDTHAHMNSPDFKKDFDAVMARAAKEKVGAVVNIGFDLASSQETLALTKRYEQFYGAVGVHPHDASTYNEAIEKELGQMAADAKMLAIGEIGLDYYRDLSPRDLQDQAFRAQLRMAKRLDMPIVIHCRDAFDDVLSVLVDEGPAWRGIFHAFSGDLADADRVLELGFHIGIGGIVTFKNSGLAATVSRLPTDRIVLETDAPYLTPAPYRGKRNEPAYLRYVVERVAEATGQSPLEIQEQTTHNCEAALGLSL